MARIRVPQPQLAPIYSGSEFIELLTDTELETLIDKAALNTQNNAIYERIKTVGIDCNNADHLVLLSKMVLAGILADDARKDEIINGV